MNWNDSVDPIFLPVRVSLVRHRCLISKAEARIRIALHFSSDSPTSILLSSPRWREFFVTIATRRLSTPVISKITGKIFGEDGERTKEKKGGNTARYCRQVLDLPCALQSPVIRPTTKLNSRSWRERGKKRARSLPASNHGSLEKFRKYVRREGKTNFDFFSFFFKLSLSTTIPGQISRKTKGRESERVWILR